MLNARLVAYAILALTAGACAKAEPVPKTGAVKLALPIDCVIGSSCEIQTYVDHDTSHGAKDYMCGPRTNDGHDGVDFRLKDLKAEAKGVAVLAAADGRVLRLRDGMADVSVRSSDPPSVAGKECGNGIVLDHGNGWETQYCHLARGSVRVRAGETVRAGQPIAHAGLSGDTEYPHLHFTVRHDGIVVDPFAPDPYGADCEPQSTLWVRATATQLSYKRGAVLNEGFSAKPLDMQTIESGNIAAARVDAPALVAYVRAINLEAGDLQELRLLGPSGAVLAIARIPPLDHSKAQYMVIAGKRIDNGAKWPTVSTKHGIGLHGAAKSPSTGNGELGFEMWPAGTAFSDIWCHKGVLCY